MLSYIELKGLNNEKTLSEVLTKGELNQKFVIQEKIHGSNISFRFDNEGTMTVHSRNQQITEFGKFNGLNGVMDNYKGVEAAIKSYLLNKKDEIQSFYIFGEYFGGSIQKGIDYGKEKRILFFDIYINERLVDYVTFSKLIKDIGIEEQCVKPLAIVNSFQEALDFNIKFDTNYSPQTAGASAKNNNNKMCEGIVIKQYEAKESLGYLLLCKRKNDGFLETKPVEKKEKEAKKIGLMDYINKNRIESYLSKMMDIEKLSDEHVEAILKDALKDFIIDFPDYVLDDKVKRACNAKIQGIFKTIEK